MDGEPKQQHMARKRRLIAVILIMMAALIAAPIFPLRLVVKDHNQASASRSDGTLQVSPLYPGQRAPGDSLQVSGQISEPLYPGVSHSLDLMVTNYQDMPVSLTSLTIAVDSATSNAGCDGTKNLQVKQQLASSPVIPANSTRSLTDLGVDISALPVLAMTDLPVNQDACQGATIPLHYAVESISAGETRPGNGNAVGTLPATGVFLAIPLLTIGIAVTGVLTAWRYATKAGSGKMSTP